MNATSESFRIAKKRLRHSSSVCADQIRTVGGTLEVKRQFYYRFGQTAEAWTAAVLRAVGPEDFTAEPEERWRPYPQTSYFVAILRPKAKSAGRIVLTDTGEMNRRAKAWSDRNGARVLSVAPDGFTYDKAGLFAPQFIQWGKAEAMFHVEQTEFKRNA